MHIKLGRTAEVNGGMLLSAERLCGEPESSKYEKSDGSSKGIKSQIREPPKISPNWRPQNGKKLHVIRQDELFAE